MPRYFLKEMGIVPEVYFSTHAKILKGVNAKSFLPASKNDFLKLRNILDDLALLEKNHDR